VARPLDRSFVIADDALVYIANRTRLSKSDPGIIIGEGFGVLRVLRERRIQNVFQKRARLPPQSSLIYIN
jgi:hypothetical protein